MVDYSRLSEPYVPEINDPLAAPEKSGMWKFLSYLDRPMQTLLNPIHSLVSDTDNRSVGMAAMQGLLGETEVRLSDVLKEAGVPEMPLGSLPLIGPVTGRGALGLAGEILGDPLNLVGVGSLTKAGRLSTTDDLARLFTTGLPDGATLGKTLAEQGARGQRAALSVRLPFLRDAISVLPDALNTKVLAGADRVGDFIKTTFPYKALAKPYSSDPLLQAVEIFGISGGKNFGTNLMREAAKIMPDVRAAEKITGKSWAELGPTIMNIAEEGLDPERLARVGLISEPEVLRHLAPIADKFVDLNKKAYDTLVKAGADVAELDPAFGIKYMKHVAQDGQNLPQQLAGSSRLYGAAEGKSRTFHWVIKDGVDPKIYKKRGVVNNGYIYEDNAFKIASSGDEVEEALKRGAEFHLSDDAARDIFKFDENKEKRIVSEYMESIGAKKGASSAHDINRLADYKAQFPDVKQVVRLVEDPLTSAASMIHKTSKQAAAAQMGQWISKNADWVTDAATAPAGWVKMDGSFGPALKGKFVNPMVHKEITKNFDPRNLDETINQFIETLAKGQGWWKAMTMAVPATTTRNLFSGFIQNAWGGNISIKDHYNGLKHVMAGMYKEELPVTLLHKAFNKVPLFNVDNFMKGSVVKGYSNEKLWKLSRELGVIDNDLLGRAGNVAELTGDMGGRTTKSIRKGIQGMGGDKAGLSAYNPAHVEGPLVKNMSVIQAGVEGQGRMALWINGMKKGMSPQESALNVAKWMLDYTPESLSAFEKKYLAQVYPFYKFMRRNSQNIAEMLATDPGKLMRTARPIMAASDKITKEEQELMPDWWKEGFTIKLSPDPGTGQSRFADLRSYVPFSAPADLMVGGMSPVRHLTQMISGVNPLIKMPFEVATNTSTFSGKRIENFPGEPDEMLGVPMTKMMRFLLSSLARPLKELDVLNPGNVFGPERVGRLAQASPTDRAIAVATGFRPMLFDEAKLRIRKKYERTRSISSLRDAYKKELQSMAQATNPATRTLYRYSLERLRGKLRELGVGTPEINEE